MLKDRTPPNRLTQCVIGWSCGALLGGAEALGIGRTQPPKDKRFRRGELWQWRELSEESELSEVSSRRADDSEGKEAVKHCATIDGAVAV